MFFVLFDFGMAILFFLLGLIFYKSKGKASNFLSGYNSKNTEERKCFDEEKMCIDYGKRMMLWATPFLIGGMVDVLKSGIGCIIAWTGFIVLFIWHMVDRTRNECNKYEL